jgi:hypothetical protein
MKKPKPIEVIYQFEEISPEETQEKLDDIFNYIFDKVLERMFYERRNEQNHQSGNHEK